ncbi:beta-N-acetylhexosaminidase [Fodinicurvata sp. EGI_FJ10296]|uniref:beta-N-acetylhexosaminidase n=1 Tax=Fodinicurvata sp. EGI_FJ10296 TaxID=3231908 RepID=UPI00345423BE
MADPAAILIGCSGATFTAEERRLIARANPLGLILFRRNCADANSIRALTAEFRDLVGRCDAPVMIDQEGGRVQRLRPPEWPDLPAPGRYAELDRCDPQLAAAKIGAHGRIIGLMLAELGITVDAAPVLDLLFDGASSVVGDRAFGSDPHRVAVLGRAMADGLSSAGVAPVMKHLPGHGRAKLDSHHGLPRVDAPLDLLEASDFVPFAALADLSWGMTAHVVYADVDPDLPATLSPTVIQDIIRGKIGFDGLLTTDDLAMGALTGSPNERVARCLDAGCDIALYCDPSPRRLASALEAARPLSRDGLARLKRWQMAASQARPGQWAHEYAEFAPPAASAPDNAASTRADTPVADR